MARVTCDAISSWKVQCHQASQSQSSDSKRAYKSLFHYTVVDKTRRALGGAHVPPTKMFRRLTGSVNKTILKPRIAAAANTSTSDFPDVKFRV